jgi:hypothetical protein
MSVRGPLPGFRLLLAALLVAAVPAAAPAHEIPRDVTVRAFVRAEGGTLRLVVRVPLEAMRDIEFPVRGPGYLDLAAAGPLAARAATQWIGDYVTFLENGAPLPPGRLVAARFSLPADPAFGAWETALRRATGPPLPDDTALPWRQAMLDAVFEYPIGSDAARFSMQAGWAHLGLRTVTVLRYAAAGRPERALQYAGDPGLVRLDPRWHHAAARFTALGFGHILDGLDHLLFLLCLIVPLRRLRTLVPVVTAFTVAHSITLAAAVLGLAPRALWFPPLVETLIALSIVYMCVENALGTRPARRWMVAFGFGLVHGFGFSFALGEALQFAGGHLVTALFAFNLGVELGQLAVVAVAAPLLGLLVRRVAERPLVIVLSVLAGHTAWHWMTARAAALAEFRFRWPALDAAALALALRWLALIALAGAAAWLLSLAFDRLAPRPGRNPA